MNLQFTILSKPVDLTEITENIKKLSNTVGLDYNELVKNTYKGETFYEIPTLKGKAETRGLFKNKDIAVAKTILYAETEIENHVHNELEVIKVLEGEIHLNINGIFKTLKKDDTMIIYPKTLHNCYVPIKTIIIAVTIPASPSWPGEKLKGD